MYIQNMKYVPTKLKNLSKKIQFDVKHFHLYQFKKKMFYCTHLLIYSSAEVKVCTAIAMIVCSL